MRWADAWPFVPCLLLVTATIVASALASRGKAHPSLPEWLSAASVFALVLGFGIWVAS